MHSGKCGLRMTPRICRSHSVDGYAVSSIPIRAFELATKSDVFEVGKNFRIVKSFVVSEMTLTIQIMKSLTDPASPTKKRLNPNPKSTAQGGTLWLSSNPERLMTTTGAISIRS